MLKNKRINLTAPLLAFALVYGQSSFGQTIQQVNDLCERISSKAEYSEVVAKLNDKFDGAANTSTPTPQEIVVVKRYWSEMNSSCQRAKINYMHSANYHPQLIELKNDYFRKLHELRVSFISGAMSWGKYIANWESLRDEDRRRGSEIEEQLAREDASARSVIEGFERLERQSQSYENDRRRRNEEWERNRPRQTSCTTSSGYTNCTTW